MDMELTAPDVDDVVEKIGTLAVERMQERVAAASDMSELYGDDGTNGFSSGGIMLP